MTWGPVCIVVLFEIAGFDIPREISATVIFLMFSSSYVHFRVQNPKSATSVLITLRAKVVNKKYIMNNKSIAVRNAET